jgi:Ser/Thr protein kinase RdoA (MazF antagonist)
MEISRSDSRNIQDDERARLLSRYSITRDSLVGVGTEAEVYNLDNERVLKLYQDVSRLEKLTLLRDLYSSLDGSAIPLALPYIYEISCEGDLLAVIERKIVGDPLSDLLPKLNGGDLEDAKRVYITSVVNLKEVKLTKPFNRRMLFDETGASAVDDWHEFLKRILESKLRRVEKHLREDVSNFDTKISTLMSILSQPFGGRTTLIHGDFFPGNLLMISPKVPTGVIDFGMFTMFGDHLFDVATAWAFFDMYGPERVQVRKEFLKDVQAVVGKENTGTLYRYLLAYSILSCDLYIAEERPQENGHYCWAVEILNDQEYWDGVS